MIEKKLSKDKSAVMYPGGMVLVMNPKCIHVPQNVSRVGIKLSPDEIANLIKLICEFTSELEVSKN